MAAAAAAAGALSRFLWTGPPTPPHCRRRCFQSHCEHAPPASCRSYCCSYCCCCCCCCRSSPPPVPVLALLSQEAGPSSRCPSCRKKTWLSLDDEGERAFAGCAPV